MGSLYDRNALILKRIRDPRPVAQKIERVLWESNRDALLAGRDRDGKTTAPLKRPRAGGPPRAPRGANSRAASAYVVVVSILPDGLKCSGSWPSFAAAASALSSGTRRMAARPMGWTTQAKQRAAEIFRDHILGR